VTALYHGVAGLLRDKGLELQAGRLAAVSGKASTSKAIIVPAARARYLAEIADAVRGYHRQINEQVKRVRQRQQLRAVMGLLAAEGKSTADLEPLLERVESEIDPHARKLVDMWPQVRESYSGDEYVVKIRDKEIRTQLTTRSLSGSRIPKVALPSFEEHGELLRWMMRENLPGSFRTPPGCLLSSARMKTRPGCSLAKATRSAPIAVSRSCRNMRKQPGCLPPLTR